jgi:hypothetical protein
MRTTQCISASCSEVDDTEYTVADDRDDTYSLAESAYRTTLGTFRSPSHCTVLSFSIQSDRNPPKFEVPLARGEFIYESILVLWLRAWVDHAESKNIERAQRGADTDHQNRTFVIPEFDMESPIEDPLYSLFAHMDIILPLCLKSIVLRCSQAISPLRSRAAKVIVDESHMAILEPFVEMLTRGLMGEALSSLGSTGSERECGLFRAMFSSDILLDFLVGLFAVLHPAHMSVLISKYFKTMTDCEIEHLGTHEGDIVFAWTEESLLRVHCARQLRIRAVERLAVLPSFIAINYPTKHSGHKGSVRAKKTTWKMQYSDAKCEDPVAVLDFTKDDGDGLLPRNAWLADLLTRECLSICALSCEAVVAEAMAVIETHHDTPKVAGSKSSSLKNRPTATLQRDELLMFQSIAIHAITCFHELLLRRHAMDTRFQKENIRGRIAALFAKPTIEKSLASVRWLTRMEATHKVRSLWLLCFVYVLQEAPEALIRDAVKSYCDPKVSISFLFCGFPGSPRH